MSNSNPVHPLYVFTGNICDGDQITCIVSAPNSSDANSIFTSHLTQDYDGDLEQAETYINHQSLLSEMPILGEDNTVIENSLFDTDFGVLAYFEDHTGSVMSRSSSMIAYFSDEGVYDDCLDTLDITAQADGGLTVTEGVYDAGGEKIKDGTLDDLHISLISTIPSTGKSELVAKFYSVTLAMGCFQVLKSKSSGNVLSISF